MDIWTFVPEWNFCSPSLLQLSVETRRSKTTARRKENRKNIPYQVDLPSRLSLIRQLPAVFSPLSLQVIDVLALGSRSTCQKLFLSVTARLGRRVWCGEVKIKTMNLNSFLQQCYELRIWRKLQSVETFLELQVLFRVMVDGQPVTLQVHDTAGQGDLDM